MPSSLAISLRRKEALDRIVAVVPVDTRIQGRDTVWGDVILLERIADAVEAQGKMASTALAQVAKMGAQRTPATESQEPPKPKRTKASK